MTDRIVHSNLVSMDNDNLRVERGPRRVKDKATPELLRKTGRQVPGEPGIGVVHDAMGKPVTLGKPMTYLDKNPKTRVWYLYRREDGRFVEKGTFDGSRKDAVAMCKSQWGAS